MRNKQIIVLALIALVLGGFGWVAVSSGQPTAAQGDSQTVKALLDEVRQLRLALQRNSVATYRAQVALERLKLQQTVVNELLREQTSARNQLRELEREVPERTEALAQLEKLLSLSANPTERVEREWHIKSLAKQIEMNKQEAKDAREREAQLVARLQAEQTKLNELNESLDKLERELETGSAAEKGKRP